MLVSLLLLTEFCKQKHLANIKTAQIKNAEAIYTGDIPVDFYIPGKQDTGNK